LLWSTRITSHGSDVHWVEKTCEDTYSVALRAADHATVIPYAVAQTIFKGRKVQAEGRMAVNLTSLSNEEFKTFISSFDTVLTDCDGM